MPVKEAGPLPTPAPIAYPAGHRNARAGPEPRESAPAAPRRLASDAGISAGFARAVSVGPSRPRATVARHCRRWSGPFLWRGRRLLVTGHRTRQISNNGVSEPLGRVKPAIPEFDQPPGRRSDCSGQWIGRACAGRDVRQESIREREGLKGRGWGVAWPVL